MAEGGIDTSIPGHSVDWALWKRKTIANRKYKYAMVKVKNEDRAENWAFVTFQAVKAQEPF